MCFIWCKIEIKMILNEEHYSLFVKAINEKKKIKMLKRDKEWNIVEKYYIPWDFAIWKKLKDKTEKYWNYNIEDEHTSPTNQEDVVKIVVLDETFDPADYIDWEGPYDWAIKRDWGIYS